MKDIKALGTALSAQLTNAILAWEIAVESIPETSRTYKMICKTGIKVQNTYHHVKNELGDEFGIELVSEYFTVNTYCGFN